MNFRKVKLDLQTWLSDNHFQKPGMQILEGKNLPQDITMLSSWVTDWDTKTTLVCYNNDVSEADIDSALATFKSTKNIPIDYNKEFVECRLVVMGHLDSNK